MLSRDGTTGWPTEKDPDPAARRPPHTRMLTGYPKEAKPRPRPEPQTNAELDRRLAQAKASRAKTQVRRIAALVYQAYEVEPLTKVPKPGGAMRLFSRSCKLAKCNRHFFEDEQQFLDHVFQMHGSADKDARYRELTGNEEEQ